MIWLCLFALISCDSDDDNNTNYAGNCDFNTLISADLFANAPDDPLSITNFEINENCLVLELSSSGCDGNTWEVQLIDSDQLLESFPVQRNIRLSLQNMELCDAVISKTFSFDLTELQVPESNQVNLNLTNSGDQILYEYE
ncbi:hypothetical protein [Psychroflexus planctonicus]|uniref:Uncharacterized protein n=1 Tax=Psychroflexus planctonicus TaxID=1526575 RepID=A0ABQ1SI05_9FLAO|nr:hypothetical protein [Psychroflexus planctonicus]GGE37487.1 hypothetical protein GCM10010832_17130 [Psychroflexus planctonicus]